MKIFHYINSALGPFIIIAVVWYGYKSKIDVFEAFTDGAKNGILTAAKILPSLIGLLCAVHTARAAGLLNIIETVWRPLENITGFPAALVPLATAKAFSSSAATGILLDIYKNFGTDTYIGRLASIMMCCTETVFYTMSVYFADVKIKDSRYILKCTFFGMLCGILTSMALA